EPVLDPRVDWVAASLARDCDVCEIGTYRFNERGSGPSLERISEHRHRIRVERTRHDWDWMVAPSDQANPVVQQLALLFTYACLPERALSRALGAFDADAATLDRFRELCTYFVNTNGALIEAVDAPERRQKRSAGDELVFLYQGGFAPGRGIEHLIRAWAQVDAPARLLLRGPDNPFKAEMERLAESLDLKNRRVFFPEPVSEARLVEAAAEA